MGCNTDLLNNWRLKSQLTGINNLSKGLTKNQKQQLRQLCFYNFMIDLTWVTVQMLRSGLFV